MFFLFPDLPKRVDTKKNCTYLYWSSHETWNYAGCQAQLRPHGGHLYKVTDRFTQSTEENVGGGRGSFHGNGRTKSPWIRLATAKHLDAIKKKVNLICSSTLWMIRSASNMQMWRLSRDEISHGYLFDKERSRSAVRWPEALPHILALSKKLFRTKTQVSHSVTHRGQKEC